MKKSIIVLGLLLATGLHACKKDKATDTNISFSPTLPEETETYFTKNNGFDNINEKATLGRVLFYDKHLSLNNAVSCASCHKQEYAFADNVAFSNGFDNRSTNRNSIAIQGLPLPVMNNNRVANTTFLFWDGRETNVANLIARPITNHVEMGISDVAVLNEKLAGLPYYNKLFVDAYGDGNIDITRISECMGLFISSITGANTRFDEFTKTGEGMSAKQMEGYTLFQTKYQCINCHNIFPGGHYGEGSFFDIGLDAVATDKGRGEFSGTGMNGAFKVPNLRNVERTAPYMHDGRFATISNVIDHYSHGIKSSANLNPLLKDANGEPLRMNISAQEKDALIAFLNTLTDYETITATRFSDPFITQ